MPAANSACGAWATPVAIAGRAENRRVAIIHRGTPMLWVRHAAVPLAERARDESGRGRSRPVGKYFRTFPCGRGGHWRLPLGHGAAGARGGAK